MTISAPEQSLHAPDRLDPGAVSAWTEELYTSHGRMVLGLCRMLLRDRGDAEDASQQAFLSAYRALLNGSRPREPAAWLATIARNECRGRARARMREPLAVQDADLGGSALDPLAEAVRRADLADLWRAIAELPEQQRDALLLREFGGLSYEELAAALAVTGPAVESLLFRARQTLRVRLKAAYAALTGASWIETIVRLLAGGSAPVATKAVAIGLGAAALTGGAVVVPRTFQHPVRPRSAVPVSLPRAPAPAVPAAAESAVLLPVRHRIGAAVAPVVFAAERQRPEGDGGGGDAAAGQAEAVVGGEADDQSGPARPLVASPSRDGSSSDGGGEGGSPQGDSGPSSQPSGGESGRDGGSPDGGSGDPSGSGDSSGDDPSGSAAAPPADGSDG